jgi:antitoxin component of MazEF toxin-antitoxin module
LCFAADQINDSVCIPNLFLKALGLEVNHSVCVEVAHKGDIIRGCGRDGSHTRATGQLNRISSNVSCRPVNDHRLACFELGLIKQRLPCRHGNDRNRGSFNVS